MNVPEPSIIKFPKYGKASLGYISLAENESLPFEVKRVYWTYYTPEDVKRGGHCHIELQQILIALAGTIEVNTEMPGGIKQTFVLDKPDTGLLIPKLCWRQMKYTHNAVQMCIASIEYDESDYIRDYDKFKNIKKLHE